MPSLDFRFVLLLCACLLFALFSFFAGRGRCFGPRTLSRFLSFLLLLDTCRHVNFLRTYTDTHTLTHSRSLTRLCTHTRARTLPSVVKRQLLLLPPTPTIRRLLVIPAVAAGQGPELPVLLLLARLVQVLVRVVGLCFGFFGGKGDGGDCGLWFEASATCEHRRRARGTGARTRAAHTSPSHPQAHDQQFQPKTHLELVRVLRLPPHLRLHPAPPVQPALCRHVDCVVGGLLDAFLGV